MFISSNRLTATIPSSDFQTAGDYPVRVRNPQPGGGDSSTLTFTALPVGPSSVAISPQTPTGGTSCVGAVYLNGPAPVGGVTIALSKVGDAIGIPSTVTASAGSFSAVFTVTTTPVSIDTTCTVLATVGTITRSGSVIVRAPKPNSMVLNPSSVRAGQSSSGTFTLTGPAPVGGISVEVASGAPSLVQVPPTVFVPAGGTGGTFPITTRHYGVPVDIAVWALYKKKGASALLHLSP